MLATAIVEAGTTVPISVGAVVDPDNDAFTYTFGAQRGKVDPVGPIADPTTKYTAPAAPGADTVTVHVIDARGGAATATLRFNVVMTSTAKPETPAAGAPKVKISDPANGAEIPASITVKGSASGLQAGAKIWTFVHHRGSFWPQRQALLVGETWSAEANVGGGPSDRGKEFDVLAVVADSAADTAFADWLARGVQTGAYPPFSGIPAGATIADRVTVKLK